MKYTILILTLLLVVLLLSACKDNAELTDTSNIKYRYAQTLIITKGFYRGFACGLLREYEDSVFCRLELTPSGGDLKEEYKINVNIYKDNICVTTGCYKEE